MSLEPEILSIPEKKATAEAMRNRGIITDEICHNHMALLLLANSNSSYLDDLDDV